MPTLLELATVLVVSMFKFLVGVLLSIGYEFHFWIGVPVTVMGSMLGVFLFTFFGRLIRTFLVRLFRKRRLFRNLSIKRKRMIVHVKNKYGLPGIAFLTPLVLTVPLGTIIAVALGFHWKRIAVAMLISFSLWSLFLFTLYEVLGVDLPGLVADWFGT